MRSSKPRYRTRFWDDPLTYIGVGGLIGFVFWSFVFTLANLPNEEWAPRWVLAALGFGTLLAVSVGVAVYCLRLPVRRDHDEQSVPWLRNWEFAVARRAGPHFDRDPSAFALIVLALEGEPHGIVGALFPHVQRRRIVAFVGNEVLFAHLASGRRVRDPSWRGSLDEIEILDAAERSLNVQLGEHELLVPWRDNERLSTFLGLD